MAGVYGGIQSASIAQGGPKLPDGFHGIVEIVNETVKNGFHGITHIAEMVVHETNHHEAPAGFRPSWTANFKQPNTLGNVKAHIGACLGFDPKTQEAQISQQVTEQVADYCVSEKQPLRGRFVEVSTEEIKTRGNNDFLLHRWSPTTKTFPSRISDAPVGAPSAPAAALPAAPPLMPGAFVMPGAQAAPSAPMLPGAPMPGFPQAAPQMAAPSLPGFPAPSAAPTLPGFPPTQGAPMLPGMPGPAMGAPMPPTFAPPAMQLPPIPVSAPPPVVQFPPPGWAKHPDPNAAAQGWYYNTQNPAQMKTEADLRAGR